MAYYSDRVGLTNSNAFHIDDIDNNNINNGSGRLQEENRRKNTNPMIEKENPLAERNKNKQLAQDDSSYSSMDRNRNRIFTQKILSSSDSQNNINLSPTFPPFSIQMISGAKMPKPVSAVNPVMCLNELASQTGRFGPVIPVYKVVNAGTLSNGRSWFACEVTIRGIQFIGYGKGFSKKMSKNRAAFEFLESWVAADSEISDKFEIPLSIFKMYAQDDEELKGFVAEQFTDVGIETGSDEPTAVPPNVVGASPYPAIVGFSQLKPEERRDLPIPTNDIKNLRLEKESVSRNNSSDCQGTSLDAESSKSGATGSPSLMMDSDVDDDPVIELQKLYRTLTGNLPDYDVHRLRIADGMWETLVYASIQLGSLESDIKRSVARAPNELIAKRICAAELLKILKRTDYRTKNVFVANPGPSPHNVASNANVPLPLNIHSDSEPNVDTNNVDLDLSPTQNVKASIESSESPKASVYIEVNQPAEMVYVSDITVKGSGTGRTMLASLRLAWQKIKLIGDKNIEELTRCSTDES